MGRDAGDAVSVAETVTRRTGVAWVPAYGASELPVHRLQPGSRRAAGQRRASPCPACELRVVSLETGEPVPAGETGEIQVRVAVADGGYLPDEETAGVVRRRLVPHRRRRLHRPDGWVHLTDRSKEMIKVRGFQVAPAEVEGVLHGHPAVRTARCSACPTRPTASRSSRRWRSIRRGRPPPADELIALVGDRLASYKKPAPAS